MCDWWVVELARPGVVMAAHSSKQRRRSLNRDRLMSGVYAGDEYIGVCLECCDRFVGFPHVNHLVVTLKPQIDRPLYNYYIIIIISPLIAVPVVTANPSTASVPTSCYSMW